MSRSTATAALLGAVLLLGACGADDADTTADGEPGGTTGETGETGGGSGDGADGGSTSEDGGSGGGSDSGSEGGDPGEAGEPAAPLDPVACLEGEWEFDRVHQAGTTLAGMQAALGDIEVDVDVTGESGLTFAGGRLTSTYDDATSVMTMVIEGSTAVSTTVLNGTVVGAYSATPTELTLSDLDASALTADMSMTADGQPVDIGATGGFTRETFEIDTTSTYTCTADRLELVPVGGLAVTGGVDTTQVLVRR